MSLQTQPNGGVIAVTRKRSPEEIIELQKQKIAQLEAEKNVLVIRVTVTEEVSAATSADLQALMEYIAGGM